MLRTAILTVVFILALIPISTRNAQTIEQLRLITVTPEQALNLNPILSDDGSYVAFESTFDLAGVGGSDSFHLIRAAIRPDSVAYEEVARSRAPSSTITADGSKIAFASTEDLCGQNPDRNSEIYFFNGLRLQQITDTRAGDEFSRLTDGNFNPSISADGRWIAFTSNRNLTSSTGSQLFLFDNLHGTTRQLNESADRREAFTPQISGDGNRIFFIQKNSSTDDAGDLMVCDPNTTNARLLVSNVEALSVMTGRSISRDGNRIVYSARTGLNETEVFLFDLIEDEARQLTHLGSRSSDVNLNPTISGDGKRIAFATRRKVTNTSDGSVELYLLDLPTGSIQQITNSPTAATAEVVSSLNFNGSLMAFSFPRMLSASVSDSALANNPEIYLASIESRPQFGQITVANAASTDSKESRIAPDSIALISGHELASGREQSKPMNGNLPLAIRGTTVQVSGHLAPLFYVSPDEVVFLVPSNTPDGPAEVVVTNSEGFPSKATAIITRTAPGVFSANGQAIMLNTDSQIASPFDPTDGSLSVSIFATGVRNASALSVTIAGESLSVSAVLPSTLPGLDEIHVRLPSTLRGAGTAPVLVRTDDVDSNLTTTTIAGSPLRDIMINEVLADPPDGSAGDSNHDGARDSSADEFIELVNSTTRDIDLAGYQLQTRSLSSSTDVVRHRFAPGTIFAAGTAFVVFGAGTIDKNQPAFGGAQVVKASSGGLSLNNSGGVVTLRDSAGAIVTSIIYGAVAGAASDANQSVTRFPDVVGNFVLHRLASNMQPFSPGTTVAGAPFGPSPAANFIVVSPVTANLLQGSQLQFTAKAFDAANEELSDVIFNWTSSNEPVVTINSAGVAKAISSGTAEIVAVGRGVRSTAAVVNVSSPTPTPTPIPTPTPTPTATPTPTPSPSPSAIPTPTPAPTATPTPIPSPTPSPGRPPLLISEFRTRGPNGASDEFIEFYNNSDHPVNAGGLKIRGSSGSGSITTRLTINATTIIPARGHFLAINSSGYSGNIAGDQSFTSGIANDGGIALTLADDSVIDQVGMSSGSAFREGVMLPALPVDSNQSYERKPGGLAGSTQDTQDNSQDFQIVSPSDPQNVLSNPTPGALPSPSPTPIPSPSPSPSPSALPSPSPSPSPSLVVVISQVFGGGGNSGAPFRNDFIEVFNAGTSQVNLSGWSVQYASATASTWSVTPLTAITLAPGQYYLIQETSGGTNGASLPTPDATGSISLAAGSGKVALVRSITALSGTCPSDANIVDFVGYGTTANCFEGSAATPAPSNTMAIARGNNGCVDTGHNSLDFILSVPTPRNTSSPTHACSDTNSSNSLIAELLCWFVLMVALTG
jgi:uncharacterized protein (TIGR03437 family)